MEVINIRTGKRPKVKHLRVELDETQKEMAIKLEVTSQYISFIENGRANGSFKFWNRFKRVYNIQDDEMESYREIN